MLLSYNEILALCIRGIIVGVDPEYVNAASVDLTLGRNIMAERITPGIVNHISLADRKGPDMVPHDCTGGYTLLPGQFILAETRQKFYLPNDISAEYKLKSSMARAGLDHALAGWCDAGWHGSVLTLELRNVTQNTAITLKAGDRIGQMIFFKHMEVPDAASYAHRGRYNNDESVSGVKE